MNARGLAPLLTPDLETDLGDHLRLGVSRSELSAMLHARVAQPVLGDWARAGSLPDNAAVRAAALETWAGSAFPHDAVVCASSAAWLWLGGAPPTQIELRVRRQHRAVRLSHPSVKIRDGLPEDSDVASLGSLRVVTPLRAAGELLGGLTSHVAEACRLLRLVGIPASVEPPQALLRGLPRLYQQRIVARWPVAAQALR